VTLVVMLVLVVLSVMSGLLADTRQQNHNWSGDIVVGRDSLVGFGYYDEFIAELLGSDVVVEATPIIKTFGLEGKESNKAVQLFGVRLGEFCKVTGFVQTLHYQKENAKRGFAVPVNPYRQQIGEGLSLEQRRRGFIAGIYYLAEKYAGRPSKNRVAVLHERGLEPQSHIDWQITVFGLSSLGTMAGSGLGEHQTFWYVDDSDTGLVDVDMSAIYVDFDELQKLCFMDGSDGWPRRTSEIRIRLAEGVEPAQGRKHVATMWEGFAKRYGKKQGGNLLTDVKVQTWKEYRRNYIAPVEKERILMIVVFGMISLVVVFIVFAIFYMMVTKKIKDLGIIKSLGASGWQVSQIFIGYGMLIGMLGALLGTGLGVAIVRNSNQIEDQLNKWFGFQLWDPEVYAISRIPDVVDIGQAAVIALVAIFASVAGAALPGRRAAKLEVIEALRVE